MGTANTKIKDAKENLFMIRAPLFLTIVKSLFSIQKPEMNAD
jgi:hypothetical protein